MKIKNSILAFLIIGGLGTLFHFVYEWTYKNYIAGLFFPVNESIWEHLKLIFYPTLIYSVYEYIRVEVKPKNYIPVIALGISAGKLTTVTLYYLYSGILGFNVDFLNIIIFFIAVIVTIAVKNKMIFSEKFSSQTARITSALFLIICGFLFAIWSYTSPMLGIFIPPNI